MCRSDKTNETGILFSLFFADGFDLLSCECRHLTSFCLNPNRVLCRLLKQAIFSDLTETGRIELLGLTRNLVL